jgi:hypothetical protein
VAVPAAVRTTLTARVTCLVGPTVLLLADALCEDAEREVARGASPGPRQERPR